MPFLSTPCGLSRDEGPLPIVFRSRLPSPCARNKNTEKSCGAFCPAYDGVRMIDHVGIFVQDLAASRLFYEAAFQPLQWHLAFGEDGVYWAFELDNKVLFEIMQCRPGDCPSSSHIAFRVRDTDHVNRFYRAALTAGGRDNGPPGPRPEYTKGYYACFVLDPDGHNIEAMFDQDGSS